MSPRHLGQGAITSVVVRVRRRWRIALAVVAVVVLGWGVAAYLFIIDPSVSRPQHVDAIVILGGATTDGRLQRGIELAEQGYAPNLLISQPSLLNPFVRHACAQVISGVTVTCFKPDPTTTQGEAREIRAQAAAHGWKKVMVVTSKYHISRARLIVQRCYSGQVLMVDARNPSFGEWTYNLLYQTGAYAKALVHPGC